MDILGETTLELLREKFSTYQENDLVRVAIINFPIQEHIRELTTRNVNMMVRVAGVVTRRGPVLNQIKKLWMDCAKCSFTQGPFSLSQHDEKMFQPNNCPECQSKGPFIVNRTKTVYEDFQSI